MHEQGPEKQINFIDAPIALNNDLILTNDDIENTAPEETWPRETLMWREKEGFPTYHLNPTARLLIVAVDGFKVFFLKPDSKLLADFSRKYERPGKDYHSIDKNTIL